MERKFDNDNNNESVRRYVEGVIIVLMIRMVVLTLIRTLAII